MFQDATNYICALGSDQNSLYFDHDTSAKASVLGSGETLNIDHTILKTAALLDLERIGEQIKQKESPGLLAKGRKATPTGSMNPSSMAQPQPVQNHKPQSDLLLSELDPNEKKSRIEKQHSERRLSSPSDDDDDVEARNLTNSLMAHSRELSPEYLRTFPEMAGAQPMEVLQEEIYRNYNSQQRSTTMSEGLNDPSGLPSITRG